MRTDSVLKFLPCVLSVALLAGLCVQAPAGDRYWNVPTGDWDTDGDWSPAIEPAADDVAYVTNGGTADITLAGEICRELYVGGVLGGTVEMSSGDLTAGWERIGAAGTGDFTQSGGTNTVTGAAGILLGDLGSPAVGTYSQTGGITTTPQLRIAADIDSSGTYIFGGTGQLTAELEFIGDLDVGSFVQNGGTHTVSNIMYITSGPWRTWTTNQQGSYELRGGTLTAGVPGNPYPEKVDYDNPASEYVGFKGHGRAGSFTQTEGLNRVGNQLHVGYQHWAQGTYDQKEGDVEVSNDLNVAVNAWSSGEYILGVPAITTAPDLEARDESVGWGGWGTFTQHCGTNTCRDLWVARYHSGSTTGTYTLNEGLLTATRLEHIGRGGTGKFIQNGGINTTPRLRLGSRTSWVAGGTYTLNGGMLHVTGTSCAYIGDEGIGVFEHTGGDCNVAGKLYLGHGARARGSYTLNIVTSGQLTVNEEIRVGADGGRGRFEWFNGPIDTPLMTLGPGGELAMGQSFNVSDLANGQLFVAPGTVSGLPQAVLEITNGATGTHNAGSHSFGMVRAGSDDGGGTYTLTGTGQMTTGYLEVNSNGQFKYTGGTLAQITGGGLHVAGDLDFNGASVSVNVGADSLVNFQDANFILPGSATVSIASNTLTILPSTGWSPGQFAGYTNYGREHTAGSTLVIGGAENYTFQGHINDHVQCGGSIAASPGRYVNLNGGLAVSGSGTADLGTGTLTVNDTASGVSGTGQLSAGGVRVGDGGTGTFVQDGADCTVRGDLCLGLGGGGDGSYTLQGGATLTAENVYVGYDGIGRFDHYGGNSKIEYDLYVGYHGGSHGEYVSWAVTSNIISGFACATIGYEGTGVFTQHDGTHTTGVLTLGEKAGSSGIYRALGGSLDVGTINVGLEGTAELEIAEAAHVTVTVSDVLRFGPAGSLDATLGAAIHLTGTSFDVWSTTPANLDDLGKLKLTIEGGNAEVNECDFEAAGQDKGLNPAGWISNFALGTLQLGRTGPGRIRLVDGYDNHPGEDEAVYVETLVLHLGAVIDLNGFNLYFRNGEDPKQLFLGDATLDGCVDGADYTAWADNYHLTGMSWGEGDFTGDEYVDGADYTAWADNYKAGCGTEVPEPTCALLVAMGLPAVAWRRRRT